MINQVTIGDCRDVMWNIPDNSVDMILCDLPYGTTRSHWDIIIPFDQLWPHYKRIVKENGAIVLFGMEPFSSRLRLSNLDDYKYDWIWEKGNAKGHLNAKKQPMRAHETISVFYEAQCVYNPQMTRGHERKVSNKIASRYSTEVYGEMKSDTKYDSTERYPRSVLKFSADTQRRSFHSNQKPVALLEYLIRTYSNEGGLILDNCSGSGSTGIASMNTNRDFILIEKDEQKAMDSIKWINSNKILFHP